MVVMGGWNPNATTEPGLLRRQSLSTGFSRVQLNSIHGYCGPAINIVSSSCERCRWRHRICAATGRPDDCARALWAEYYSHHIEHHQACGGYPPGYGIIGKPSSHGWNHEQDSSDYDVVRSGRWAEFYGQRHAVLGYRHCWIFLAADSFDIPRSTYTIGGPFRCPRQRGRLRRLSRAVCTLVPVGSVPAY